MILWIPRLLKRIPKLEGPLLNLESGNNKRVEFTKIKDEYRGLVPFLHIESRYFDPKVYLEAFHSNEESKVLRQNRSKIRRYLDHYTNDDKTMLSKNVNQVLDVFL